MNKLFEVADLVAQARNELTAALRILDGILPAHPALPQVLMRLLNARSLSVEALVRLLGDDEFRPL